MHVFVSVVFGGLPHCMAQSKFVCCAHEVMGIKDKRRRAVRYRVMGLYLVCKYIGFYIIPRFQEYIKD
jgi:hypothetical protein